jgi:hypothetical protein
LVKRLRNENDFRCSGRAEDWDHRHTAGRFVSALSSATQFLGAA